MQRALMQFFIPNNHKIVMEALKKAGREDLIGWGNNCLIPPYLREKKKESGESKKQKQADGRRSEKRKDEKNNKNIKRTRSVSDKKTEFGKTKTNIKKHY